MFQITRYARYENRYLSEIIFKENSFLFKRNLRRNCICFLLYIMRHCLLLMLKIMPVYHKDDVKNSFSAVYVIQNLIFLMLSYNWAESETLREIQF